MVTMRTDVYYARIKLAIFTLVVTFISAFFAFGTTPAGVEGAEITLNTYPLRATLFWIWFFSSPLAVLLLWHSIYKDKQVLSEHFSEVKKRHWITIGIFSWLSSGIYVPWYLYARYKQTKNENSHNSSIADGFLSITKLITSLISSEMLASGNNEVPTNENKSQQKESTSKPTTPDVTESVDVDFFSNIKEIVNKGDSLLKKAREARDNNNYNHALNACDEAQTAYQNALEAVAKEDLSSRHKNNIKEKINKTKKGRQKAEKQHLKYTVAPIHAKFDEIKTLVNNGKYKNAEYKLQKLNRFITSAEESVNSHSHTDSQTKIASLEQQRVERLNEVTDQLKRKSIPDTIPKEPELSVNYADLNNKKPIGGGGNADVNKAVISTSKGDFTVAIKEPRMSGTLHSDAIERMLEEAETWDKLDNNNHIVGVIDYGSDPLPWIAMEYMDAGHLGKRGGEFGIAQTLWTAIAITEGVRHAHKRGIAHLDLKPENVLFRSVENKWDVPKVADWGLSKHLLDHSKSVEGLSPQYAAPEQFDDKYGSADDITDIYQLGTIFYELFTGQPPFGGKPAEVMHNILNEDPTTPSEIADVPDKLDKILLTALSKEKDKRHDDILYLRDELQELSDNHPAP